MLKPGYIFAAVIGVSLLMFSLLPLMSPADDAPAPAALPVVTLPAEDSTTPAEQPGMNPAPPPEPPAAQQPAPQFAAVDAAVLGDTGLAEFAARVRGGQPADLAGVFAPGVLALPVAGQPPGDANYVASEDNVLTQYQDPLRSGVVALLAHNYLSSGQSFYRLKPGQEVYLVYGDGRAARFRVTGVEFFQALDPLNVHSDFRDLNGPSGALLSADQLYQRMYATPNRLVFQTCLEANGDPSWGRMFVQAEPAG